MPFWNEAVRFAESTDSSSTGSVNNYALSQRYNILFTNSGLTAITGIAAEKDGQQVYLKTSTVAITLVHNSASSTSGNRILVPSGTDYAMPANSMAALLYDSTLGAWLLQNAASSGGTGLNGVPVRNYYASSSDASTVPQVSGTGLNTGYSTYTRTDPTLFAATASSTFARTASTSLRGSFVYTVTGASASSSGATKIQFPLFTLDGMDLGKAVRVSFDVTSSLVDGDWDVYIERFNSSDSFQAAIAINGGTGTSACSNTPSAKVPAGTSSFSGFFVTGSTATDKYALTFRRITGSSGSISVDTVYVGPATTTPGNAVTDWVSYTPTGNWANTTYTGMWRRVGDNAEIRVGLVCSSAPGGSNIPNFTIPTGLTIDTTKIARTTAAQQSLGSAILQDAGVATYSAGVSYFDTTTVRIESASGTAITPTSPFSFAVNDTITATFSVPIVGWSSNITVADRALEEYASNSSTTDADDSTSFAYGPTGSLLPGALTAPRLKRVNFLTTIQPTDTILVEIQSSGSGAWTPVFSNGIGSLAYQVQGTVEYGMAIVGTVGTNAVTLYFAQYARPTNAVYATAGQSWSAVSTYRYRLRKIAGGALIGYPIAASNLTGAITADSNGVVTQSSQICFSAYNTSNQSGHASATAQKIGLALEEFDVGSKFDSSTNYRFTPGVSGKYQLSASIAFSGSLTYVEARIYKNGVHFKTLNGSRASTSSVSPIGGSVLVDANTTDYFELYGYAETSAGTWGTFGSQSLVWFSGMKVA